MTFNQILPVVNVLPITSRKPGRKVYANEVLLEAGTGNLNQESLVLCYQIRTLDKHGQSSGLKVWISIKFNELSEQEKLKSRDVSHIGHWGMGETEYIVKNERDFDMLVGIVKKAFDKTRAIF